MSKESESEQFTPEDLRYLKVAIALALGLDDNLEMQKTKTALNEIYHESSSITKVDCPNSPGRLMDDVVVVVAFSAVISYLNVFATGSYSGLKSSITA
jgi:hypothetical protein